jgi:hypothetical protein
MMETEKGGRDQGGVAQSSRADDVDGENAHNMPDTGHMILCKNW